VAAGVIVDTRCPSLLQVNKMYGAVPAIKSRWNEQEALPSEVRIGS
jgi:hypothetical protein